MVSYYALCHSFYVHVATFACIHSVVALPFFVYIHNYALDSFLFIGWGSSAVIETWVFYAECCAMVVYIKCASVGTKKKISMLSNLCVHMKRKNHHIEVQDCRTLLDTIGSGILSTHLPNFRNNNSFLIIL